MKKPRYKQGKLGVLLIVALIFFGLSLVFPIIFELTLGSVLTSVVLFLTSIALIFGIIYMEKQAEKNDANPSLQSQIDDLKRMIDAQNKRLEQLS